MADERTYLKQYDALGEYIIDKERGSGGSCIVYDAHYKDGAGIIHKVLIKECFPHGASVSRNASSGELIWKCEEERDAEISSFKEYYSLITNLKYDSSIQDSIAHTREFFKKNNTAYSVVDFNYGIPFDQMNKISTFDVLLILLGLTNVVGKFHDSGYLHLDIKPENFLVTETTNRVVLFDVDSVVRLSDIKENKITNFRHTTNWAAPELNDCSVKKISEVTDIYSIGAILFHRVFNRCPDANDSRALEMNRLDFDHECLKGFSQKEVELLAKILKKTVCTNVKDRYRNTDSLSEDLNKLIKSLNTKRPLPKRKAPKKNHIIAGLLALFLGFLGAQWFYSERYLRGVIYMILTPICCLVYFLLPFYLVLYLAEALTLLVSQKTYDKYRKWHFSDFVNKIKNKED